MTVQKLGDLPAEVPEFKGKKVKKRPAPARPAKSMKKPKSKGGR